MKLILHGHVPGKKNRYKRSALGGGRRGMFQDPQIASQLDYLVLQAKAQWKCEPLEEVVHLIANFTVRDGRGDLDGKYAALQDCLVTAGVIRNDSIARIRGFAASAVIGEPERVEVDIW